MMAGRGRGEAAAAIPSAGGQLARTSLLSLAGDGCQGMCRGLLESLQSRWERDKGE